MVHVLAVIVSVWSIALVLLAIIVQLSRKYRNALYHTAIVVSLVGAALSTYTGETLKVFGLTNQSKVLGVTFAMSWFEYAIIYVTAFTLTFFVVTGKKVTSKFLGLEVLKEEENSTVKQSDFVRQVLKMWLHSTLAIAEQFKGIRRNSTALDFSENALAFMELIVPRLVTKVRKYAKVESDTTFDFRKISVSEVNDKRHYVGLDYRIASAASRKAVRAVDGSNKDKRATVTRRESYVARRIGDHIVLVSSNKAFDVEYAEDLLNLLADMIESLR